MGQIRINGRRRVSFSWAQAERISDYVGKMDKLGETRRTQYSTLFLLAAASGLRSSELLALRVNNIDLSANTVRVEESSDQRTLEKLDRAKTPLPTERFCSATQRARKQCTG
jgi:integrase